MIGEWMAWLLVVTTSLAVAAAAIDPFTRGTRRPTRWTWVLVFALSLIGPVAVAVRPVSSGVAAPGAVASPLPATLVEAAEAPTPSMDVLLGVAWGLATVIMLSLLAVGLWQLARVRRQAGRDVMAGREVVVTGDLGPGAAPFGHPRILVPRWASALPAEAMRLLVVHEEEHVRAGDARLLLGAALVVAAMPWSPALWWSLRRLRTAIELDCDARVLAREPGVHAYADLLLRVAGRGSGRGMPALLAFADGTTQLNTRIDAMTTRRLLTPFRRAVLGVAAGAAVLVACETRRPAPVAPVSDFVMQDGKTMTLTFDEREADSVKVTLSGVLADAPAELRTADEDRPLLMVFDATGKVVFSGRVDGSMEAAMRGVAADNIATVDVVKRGDLLPPEAKGGMIRITLKPGASWPGAAADSVAGVFYRSPGAVSPRAETAGTAARVTIRRAPADSTATGTGAVVLRSSGGPPPTVILEDAEGKVLFEGPMGAKGEMGPFRVDPSVIATVNVHKGTGSAGQRVVIRLKPGVAPERVR